MAMGGISYRTGNKAGIIFEPGDSPIALSKAVKGAYKSTYALINQESTEWINRKFGGRE